MVHALLDRLVRGRVLAAEVLREIAALGPLPAERLERLLAERGVPRHELLHALSELHGRPFVEYSEGVVGPAELLKRLDPEELKAALWFPLSVRDGSARVIAWNPADPAVRDGAAAALGVHRIEFTVALPSDVVRIVEHNLDLNPGFPRSAGRTPLAKVRTLLAQRRSLFACIRTSLARGRTGLAILRTGLSFVAIALVLHRVFGLGPLTVLEVLLAAAGAAMIVEGLRWYLQARRSARQRLPCVRRPAADGATVLEAVWDEEEVAFDRSDPVPGATELRAGWSTLSPVMRRRLLAGDRTDLAEERTFLACLRTRMARARTGLAFARTGIAFVGLGTALFRVAGFRAGAWPLFDAAVLLVGAAMIAEGSRWYFMDRRAGAEGHASVRSANEVPSLWREFFPPRHEPPRAGQGVPALPRLAASHAPGIWGTTGLALERTVLAERRNVMARWRTVMARSRTGLAFVRTGMSVSAVGMGLLAWFGVASVTWAALEVLLVAAGALLIADGLYWHLPAERLRRQLPYCFWDVEIPIPDYGTPARRWAKAVFSHDDL
jgi:uncharacterized membrane protein YidH (DUF202 family)